MSFWLFEPDEGRYAEIPREMLARGEWIVPYLQGQPYLDKPPLLYWLVMGSYRLLGVHDWSARLVPALAIHLCILLTYLLGCRVVGERSAFWGAMLLSIAPGFISVGRLLVLDGLLALWITLALLAAWESMRGERLRWTWWLLSAAACALGLLTKGPVALVLFAVPLLAYFLLSPPACRPGRAALLGFTIVALAIALPWYVAVCIRLPAFAGYFLWTHNVIRFLSPFDHQQPIWFYAPILFAGLLPASLIGKSWLRFLFSADPECASRRFPGLGFLLLAGLWCLLFFTLSGCKLPTYILPAFPPLCLALGYFAAECWSGSRLLRPVLGVAGALLLAAHYVAIPWYAKFHSPMSRAVDVLRYCGDPDTPVVCYPRNCDSVAFYAGRDDFRSFRTKERADLLRFLEGYPRSVLLFTHRSSPEGLRAILPPHMRLTNLVPVSRSWARTFKTEFCYMGMVLNSSPALGRANLLASRSDSLR
jgi:4-amino-4-deoxy-L-arabinose transferase-like glycosyltransferase